LHDNVAITMITDVLSYYREQEDEDKDAHGALEMINSIMYAFYGRADEKLARQLAKEWLDRRGAECNFFTGDLK